MSYQVRGVIYINLGVEVTILFCPTLIYHDTRTWLPNKNALPKVDHKISSCDYVIWGAINIPSAILWLQSPYCTTIDHAECRLKFWHQSAFREWLEKRTDCRVERVIKIFNNKTKKIWARVLIPTASDVLGKIFVNLHYLWPLSIDG